MSGPAIYVGQPRTLVVKKRENAYANCSAGTLTRFNLMHIMSSSPSPMHVTINHRPAVVGSSPKLLRPRRTCCRRCRQRPSMSHVVQPGLQQSRAAPRALAPTHLRSRRSRRCWRRCAVPRTRVPLIVPSSINARRSSYATIVGPGRFCIPRQPSSLSASRALASAAAGRSSGRRTRRAASPGTTS